MKVLFLPKYPKEGASSRYCLYQFIPFLKKNGIECDIYPFMSSKLFKLSLLEGKSFEKISLLLVAVLKRLLILIIFKKYDLIFIHRELISFGAPILEKIICSSKIPTIFCYDDALFIYKKNETNKFISLFKNTRKISDIFSMVDCVIASNGYLGEYASRFCSDTRVLEMPEDVKRISCKKRYAIATIFTIGWIGSPSTEKYLQQIKPAFYYLLERNIEVRLKIIGGRNFSIEGLQVFHIPWDIMTEAKELHSFDVGIMPLPEEEEWSLGKSGGKARLYMAAGLPVICSAVGYNLKLIKNNETGFLVSGVEEWGHVLYKLASNPELREKIGIAARKYIEQNLSLDIIGPKYLQIIQEIYNAK